MKNKYFKKTLSVVFVFFLILLLSKKFNIIFGSLYDDNKFLILGLLKLILLSLIIYFINKNDVFNWKYIFKRNLIYVVICFLSIYFSVYYVNTKISIEHLSVTNYRFSTYLFNCLLTGFFEEFFLGF